MRFTPIILSVVILTASRAVATIVATDSFSYSAGALSGANGGVGWSGAWTLSGTGATVSTPGLTYTDGNSVVYPAAGNKLDFVDGNAGNYRVPTSSPDTAGTTLYLSFIARVNAATGYSGLSLFTSTTTESLFLGHPIAQANWGIDNKSGGVVSSTVPVTTQSLLVYRIDFGASNDTISLYVNPNLNAPEPGTPAATTTRAHFVWDTIRIQSGNTSTGSIDEVRLATTFAEAAPVPEPSTATLALLGLTALGGWRRRVRE